MMQYTSVQTNISLNSVDIAGSITDNYANITYTLALENTGSSDQEISQVIPIIVATLPLIHIICGKIGIILLKETNTYY